MTASIKLSACQKFHAISLEFAAGESFLEIYLDTSIVCVVHILLCGRLADSERSQCTPFDYLGIALASASYNDD